MKLKTVRTGDWKVLAVCSERDDCPLLDFLVSLEGRLAKDGRRMLKLFDRVATAGPPRNIEISHHLRSGIWEFAQGQLRVLWFYDQGKLVICSHGLVKTSQKIRKREIERALENRRRYSEARDNDDLEIER